MNNNGYTLIELIIGIATVGTACAIGYVVVHFIVKFW